MDAYDPTSVFSQNVVAQLATEQAFKDIRLLNSGYIADARTTARRADGAADQVEFPYVQEVANARKVQTNPRNAVAVSADTVKIAHEPVSLESKIISIELDEKDLRKIATYSDPNQFMADMVKKWIAEHMQLAIITRAAATTLTFPDPTNSANIKGIKKGMIKNWGEKAQDAPPLVVLHSYAAYDLETSEEVMKKGEYGGLRPGEITNVAGFNWIMSDQITSTGEDAATKYNNLVLQPGSVELWFDSIVGQGFSRAPKTTAWTFDWWFEYATHIKRTNPKGVMTYVCGATLNTAEAE